VVAGLAIGSRWPEHWDGGAEDVDLFDVKGDIEALLQMTGRAAEVRFEAETHPALKPGQTARIRLAGQAAGWIGCVHPQVQRRFDLKQPAILFALQSEVAFAARLPEYERVSRFPHVRRDLALVVDEDVTVQQILDYVQQAGGALLKRTHVFDLYRGKGVEASRKSIGLGLILQDTSRTLTDQDADRTVQSVTQTLEHKLGATIRT
jgi:phenylalanyl-tRNA synthetase beta chain